MKIRFYTESGLTPVKALKDSFSRAAGEIFGVDEANFKTLFAKGIVEPVAVSKDIKSYEVNIGTVDVQPEQAPTIEPAKAVEGATLPADWRSKHLLQKVEIATALTGKKPSSKEVDAILEAIEAEIAAASDDEGDDDQQ